MVYRLILVIWMLAVLVLSGCGSSDKAAETDEYKEWEMTEVFYDLTPELLEDGGYCPYYYRSDTKLTDSLEIEGENSVVAIIVQAKSKVGETKANVWINDEKQNLVLKSDQTTGTAKYVRVYDNELFEVTVDMRIVEVIKGGDLYDEEDFLRYSGTMKVMNKKTQETKSFKIQGGC